MDNLVDQMNSYKEDQPERWTESTKGVAFADWTDEWEAIDLDPIPDAEPLDPIHADHADSIENAQTEPSELQKKKTTPTRCDSTSTPSIITRTECWSNRHSPTCH